MNTLKKIYRYLSFKPSLSQEAFVAYFHRLPDNIQVSWRRDGDMIVGQVIAGDKEFYTQGRNADEFIEMVNDAIYTAYEIPFGYIDAVSSARAFRPKEDELRALYNGKVPGANLSILRDKKLHLA
jgi:hypothetical protein